MTYPKRGDDEGRAGLHSLAMGAPFDDLLHVPLAGNSGQTADLSVYPSERFSTDLVQVAVTAEAGQPAWTAAVNTQDGYLWFALRDVAVLPSTLMWMENRGRQSAPWKGRSCLLGLEDVCSFFDVGSDVSGRENAFSARGVKTVHAFQADVPWVVSYIQGATRVPGGFGRVRGVECAAGGATFTDDRGATVQVAADADFLFGKEL
jgi:hypothetical protein